MPLVIAARFLQTQTVSWRTWRQLDNGRDEDGEGLKKKRGLFQAAGLSADTKADSFAMLEKDSATVPARPGKT